LHIKIYQWLVFLILSKITNTAFPYTTSKHIITLFTQTKGKFYQGSKYDS